MTAPLERPAGRPACGARPAGARDGRGTDTPPASLTTIRDAVGHGTPRGVRWHRINRIATCAPCRRAAAAQRAEQRKRAYLRGGDLLVDACGVRRRLEALAAIGWSRRALAAELGCDRSNVQRLLRSKRSTPETVAAVRALYDRLSMSPGPHAAARAYAARQGWPPPLAWDDHAIDDPAARPHRTGDRRRAGLAFDEVAIQRAMRGDQVHLRPAERAEAVRRLTAQRVSAAEIAARLDTTPRTVARHRSTDTSRRTA